MALSACPELFEQVHLQRHGTKSFITQQKLALWRAVDFFEEADSVYIAFGKAALLPHAIVVDDDMKLIADKPTAADYQNVSLCAQAPGHFCLYLFNEWL